MSSASRNGPTWLMSSGKKKFVPKRTACIIKDMWSSWGRSPGGGSRGTAKGWKLLILSNAKAAKLKRANIA